MDWSPRRWLLAMGVACCTMGSAAAEEGGGWITGRVLDASTGKPLPAALVIAGRSGAPPAWSALTGADGTFTLGELPAGRYDLTAQLEGYLPSTRPALPVAEGAAARAELALAPEVVRLEEVLVTGSRLRRKDLTSPAPVVILTREQLQASGKVVLGDVLQSLPAQANGINAQWNNEGDGSVRLSLRGLGPRRTLVLLNGRRFVASGTGADDSVDLGAIPAAAVERVEVLLDGASPIYGSDAMGGVVNVITRRAWSGAEVAAYTGTSSRRDGTTYDLSLTAGHAGDSASLLVSLGWSKQEAIWSADRPWSQYGWSYDANGTNSPLGQVGPYAVGNGYTPSGRAFTVEDPGVTLPNPGDDPRIDRYNQLVTAYPDATSFVPDPTQPLGWRPWRGDALPRYGGDQYNYQPENYLVTPWQRYSLFASGDVRLGARARAFAELSWVGRESEQKLAPEPVDTVSDGVELSASNRYNPFGVDLWNVRGRLLGLGNRSYAQRVDTVRAVLGLDGSAPDGWGPLEGWRWSAAAILGKSRAREAKRGYTRISALGAALGPSYDYGSPGSPDWGCGTGPGDRIAGCVPVNLFGGSGELTAAERAAITFDGAAHGSNDLVSYQVNADGDLLSLWGDRPAGLALGYEYRSVRGRFDPDPVTLSGDASTDPGERMRGSQDVHEAYAELALPLVAGISGLDLLELQAAARVFHYSAFDPGWTWKLGARWRPFRDLTIRGTLSTAFRAPSVRELSYEKASYHSLALDPCSGVDFMGDPAPVSPWCGELAGEVEPLPVVTVEEHGNPRLSPETARVLTAGLVLEPRFAPGLSLTFDAYRIDIDRVIQDVGDALSQCYPLAADVRPHFCQYVERDPATHALTRLVFTPVNVGNERMWGLDLAARYQLGTPVGHLGLRLEGTYLGRYDLVQPDGTVIHARGTYDLSSWMPGGFLLPIWKGNAGATWELGGLAAGADVRMLGGFRECAGVSGNIPSYDTVGNSACSFEHGYEHHVPPHFTWDAQVRYGLDSGAGRTELAVGVRNLMDAPPPRVYANGFFPSDPGYDFVGRYFWLRLSHRL
jgi:iron complex outermembrane recepter protein